MSGNVLSNFDDQVSEIRSVYRRPFLVDTRKIRPKMEGLCRTIKEGPLAMIKDRFGTLVGELGNLDSRQEIKAIIHIIDFCMREFKWKEVETALKDTYPTLRQPDTKLEVEGLIKRIFDPNWKGGEFDFLEIDENIWEL